MKSGVSCVSGRKPCGIAGILLLALLFLALIFFSNKQPFIPLPACYKYDDPSFACPYPLATLIAVPQGGTTPVGYCVANGNDGTLPGVFFSQQQATSGATLDPSIATFVNDKTVYLQIEGRPFFVTLNQPITLNPPIAPLQGILYTSSPVPINTCSYYSPIFD